MRRSIIIRVAVVTVTLAAAVAGLLSPVPPSSPATASGVNYGCAQGGGGGATFTGAGTVQNPYVVTNSAHLLALATNVSLSAHFVQRCDIDLIGITWPGIGGGVDITPSAGQGTGTRLSTLTLSPFTGTYDGGGRTISNVSLAATTGGGWGLFRSVSGSAITNLVLEGVTVSASGQVNHVGALVGYALNSTVAAVSVSGVRVENVSSAQGFGFNTGGLVGVAEGVGRSAVILEGISLQGSLLGRLNVGGLVGDLRTVFDAAISNNPEVTLSIHASNATAHVSGVANVGGLVGYVRASAGNTTVTVSASSVSGVVEGGEVVGGLVGRTDLTAGNPSGSRSTLTLIDAASAAGVSTSGWAAGGLMGAAYLNHDVTLGFIDSVSSGTVSGSTEAGGLVGYLVSTGSGPHVLVTGSQSTAPVIGTNDVGGVVGRIGASSGRTMRLTATDTIRTGSVQGATRVGGFVGLVGEASGTDGVQVIDIDGIVLAGSVTGSGRVGGIAGQTASGSRVTLTQSTVSAGVVATDSEAGGVIGYLVGHATISAVTRSGDVSISAAQYGVGGFVGYNRAGSLLIENSTSSSDIRGGSEAGGAIGVMFRTASLRNVVLSGNIQGALGNIQAPEGVGCYVGTQADAADPQLMRLGITRATGTKVVNGITSPCPDSGYTEGGGGSVVLPPEVSDLVTRPVAPPTTTTTTAPSTTVPTTQPSTTVPSTTTVPAPVPDGGVLPTLTPGASQVLENGVPTDVEVFVDNSTDLVLRGQDFELRLAGDCTSGCTIATDASGREVLTLEERGLANVSGEGFQAGSPVYVWLFSEPRFLGTLTVNGDGTFTGTVPLGDIAPGLHTLQVNGTSFDGLPRTANLGVVVNPSGPPSPGPGTLPATGREASGLWWVALVLLAVGTMIGGRRRSWGVTHRT